MSFDLSGEICVVVDLVPYGLEHRRENIAVLSIRPIADSAGGGFRVDGFDAGSPLGSTLRTTRIGPHGRNQSVWVLIANAAYALAHAKFDQV